MSETYGLTDYDTRASHYFYEKNRLRHKYTAVSIAKRMFISVICYTGLYFLVHGCSRGHMSDVLQIMVLSTIPPQILHGLILFFGALEERIMALEVSLWLLLLMASYNTVTGTIGCVFFIRTGHLTIQFLLSVIFAILALSLITVLCHDIPVVYAYKQLLVESTRGSEE